MDFYSPVQEVKFKDYPVIWVKRDDLIDPFISGNKWRKLKYIVSDALSKNKTHLVTFGGAYSNHLLACAAAAARLKLKCTAFVRGDQVDNEMLFLSRIFGMEHLFVSRTAYKDKLALFEEHFGHDASAYFVNEGGAGKEAVLGCAEILNEVTLAFDHIFCAAGTGTTAAGLLNSINISRPNCYLHVVPVLKDQGSTLTAISEYESKLDNLIIEPDYHFGGYAKTTPELLNFIQEFSSETGILVDQVYTGKLFYAIFNKFDSGMLNSDAKILAIHTGGMLGLLGARNLFLSNSKML